MVDQTTTTETTEKPDIFTGISRGLQDVGMPASLAEPQERMMRDYRRAAEEEAKAKAARTTAGLQAETKAAESLAGAQRQAMGAFEKLPFQPKFEVTKDTEEGLMGMAALLPIAGLLIGAKGQMSGINAMNAMANVMKGYQEGNQQRIAFETQKYEKATKEWEANYARVKDGFERAMAMAKTDYNAAVAKAKETAASVGSAELSAMLDKESLSQVYNKVSQIGQEYIRKKQQLDSAALRFVEVTDRKGNRLKIPESEYRQDYALPEAERKYTPALAQRTPIRAMVGGKLTYVDPSTGQPITDEEGKPLEAPQPRSTQVQERIGRVAQGSGAIAAGLETIKEFPAGTTTELLPNLKTKDGMMNYVRNKIGNTVSKNEADQMNTILSGMGRYLALIEAAGGMTGLVGLQQSLQEAINIKAGVDTPGKVAFKLADIRRIAEEGLEYLIESGQMSDDQKKATQKRLERIRDAIPFTTKDVIIADRNAKVPTIGQVVDQYRTTNPNPLSDVSVNIPSQAIQMLRNDPSPQNRRFFEETFNLPAGSASRYLER